MLGPNNSNAPADQEVDEDPNDPDYLYTPSRNVLYINPRSRVNRPELQHPNGVPRPTEAQRENRSTRNQTAATTTTGASASTAAVTPAAVPAPVSTASIASARTR